MKPSRRESCSRRWPSWNWGAVMILSLANTSSKARDIDLFFLEIEDGVQPCEMLEMILGVVTIFVKSAQPRETWCRKRAHRAGKISGRAPRRAGHQRSNETRAWAFSIP